jgi:hypothetical protein
VAAKSLDVGDSDNEKAGVSLKQLSKESKKCPKQKKTLSDGTLKQLRKLYDRQMQIGLTYDQMMGMNHMWQ